MVTENLPIASKVYYQVVATDGNITKTTGIQEAQTKGVVVTILLLDKNRKPVPDQTVSIKGQEVKSNKEGYATFNNLAPGEHQVELKAGGTTRKQHFVILANITTTAGRQATPDQNIFVVYDDYVPLGLVGILAYVGGGLVVAAVAVAGLLYWRRRGGFGGPKLASVPIDGLIVGGSGQSSAAKTPYDEPAYNPFESHDSTSGSGK
jgi:hypothetical protein